jgi:hypothetical protein
MPRKSIHLKQIAVHHYLNIPHNRMETLQIYRSIVSLYRWGKEKSDVFHTTFISSK